MTGLVHREMLPIHAVPVAAPAVAETVRALKGQPLLSVPAPAELWPWWARTTGETEPDGPVTRFEFTEAMYETAAQGMGIAMGSSPTVWPYLESGRLVRLPLPVAAFPGRYNLATTADRKRHRGVATAWRWLESQAAATPRLN